MLMRFQKTTLLFILSLVYASISAGEASGQQTFDPNLQVQVDGTSERIEMIVSDSRILTLDYDVPDVLVGNPELIRVTPMSPNQLLITALQAGTTPIGIFNSDRKVQAITINIAGDVRALQAALDREFPQATLRARALNSSVIVSGFVPEPEMVSTIIEVSQDYFPSVVERITVGGAQKVMLNVKIVEVSRTKLEAVGVDWNLMMGGDFVTQTVSGIVNDTLRFGLINNGTQFTALIEYMQQVNLAKILAEPKLVATSGRPASFLAGGEVPVPVNGGLGVQTVKFREFGTTVDFVPILLGNGSLRLEVRAEVNEVATDLRDPITGTPGFRTRRVDTGVEMRAGQTLALAGILQNKVETEIKGFPYLVDLPIVGTVFRREERRFNEVELLILVTPQFIEAVDPQSLSEGPGQQTVAPTKHDFFWRGHVEVPRCNHPDELGPIIPPNYMGPSVISPGVIEGPVQGETLLPTTPQATNGSLDTSLNGLNQLQRARSIENRTYNAVQTNFSQQVPSLNLNQRRSMQTQNSYNRSGGNDRQTYQNSPQRTAVPRPRFIGRTGYDVIK